MSCGSGRDHTIPVDILDDLCSRFIINIPVEERTDTNRLMFQVESAHWFFVDFYCKQHHSQQQPARHKTNGSACLLQPCGLRQFALHVFGHLPSLRSHLTDFDALMARWREYKQAVPTCGALILSTDRKRVLLVQAYQSRSWGFPKGKCNQSELGELYRCAVREVREEIDFDIEPLLNRGEFIEQVINDQRVRLYVIDGVSDQHHFRPLTRNEIRSIEWFNVADLPCGQKEQTSRGVPSDSAAAVSHSAFFMVTPFVRPLKRWIHHRNAASAAKQKTPQRHKGQKHSHSKSPTSAHADRSSVANKNEVSVNVNSGKNANSGDKNGATERSAAVHLDGSTVAVTSSLLDADWSAPRCWLKFRFKEAAILSAYDGQ